MLYLWLLEDNKSSVIYVGGYSCFLPLLTCHHMHTRTHRSYWSCQDSWHLLMTTLTVDSSRETVTLIIIRCCSGQRVPQTVNSQDFKHITSVPLPCVSQRGREGSTRREQTREHPGLCLGRKHRPSLHNEIFDEYEEEQWDKDCVHQQQHQSLQT